MKCLLRGTSISAGSRFECHEGRAVRVVVPFLFYRLAKFKAVDAFTWKLISVFTAILDNVRLNEENFPFYVFYVMTDGETTDASSRVVSLDKSH